MGDLTPQEVRHYLDRGMEKMEDLTDALESLTERLKPNVPPGLATIPDDLRAQAEDLKARPPKDAITNARTAGKAEGLLYAAGVIEAYLTGKPPGGA